MTGRDTTYKFKAADAMAPRISITWDPEANGKNKLYVFYGEYYEKVPLDLAVRELSTERTVTRSDFYNMPSSYNTLTNPILTGVSLTDVNPHTGVVGTANTNHFIGQSGATVPVLPGTKLPFTREWVVGWDTQLSDKLKVSNRLVHREIGRVLEDLGIDGGNNLPYFIGNPGQNTGAILPMALAIDPTLGNSVTLTTTWPKPIRDYWAYEVEANFNSGHWAGFFNLKLSRLEGNYEGLFRNDNGQSDPNITSLYDFTTEYMKKYETPGNPDYHPRGLTGEELYAKGPLGNDRPLVINTGLTYAWDNGFSTGVVVRWQSGTPLNKLYAIIDYDNPGELPAGGRGSQGRTPDTYTFDWSGSYMMKIRGTHSLSFKAEVFNLFNASKPINYDQDFDRGTDTPNLNFLNTAASSTGNFGAYQSGRQVRLGVKYQF
jgi:hypothetical protein